MSNIPSVRTLIGVALCVSALIGPLWLTFIFALMLSVRYRAWEVVVVAVFIDFLWLPGPISSTNLPLATLGALILIVALEPLRRELDTHETTLA